MRKQITRTISAISIVLFLFLRSYSQQPSFTITNPSGNYSITCTNTAVTLFASSNYTGGQVSYTWTGSSFGMPVFNTSVTIASPGTLTISASSGTTIIGTQTILIGQNNSLPGLTINASATAVNCFSPVVQLQGSSNTPGVAFQWQAPSPSIVEDSVYSVNAVVPGTYTLVVTNTISGCKTTSLITIGDNRIYPVVISQSIYTVSCPGGTLAITPTVYGSSSGNTFSWTVLNGVVPAILNTGTLITNGAGLYQFEVKNIYGCRTSITVDVWACAGTNTSSKEQLETLVVFPNPAKNTINFRIENNDVKECNLKLTTVSGQVIYSESDFNLKDGLSLASLEPGIYFIFLATRELQKTIKVVKE